MDTLHTFKPNLDGPASMRAASCQLPDVHENDFNAIEDDDEEINTEVREPKSDCPVCEETGLPLDLPAEFLIGVQEDDSQDPVDRMIAFQKRMGLVHNLADKMHMATVVGLFRRGRGWSTYLRRPGMRLEFPRAKGML